MIIGDIWFGCSREVGCFSKELLRKVLLYLSIIIIFTIIIIDKSYILLMKIVLCYFCCLLRLILFNNNQHRIQPRIYFVFSLTFGRTFSRTFSRTFIFVFIQSYIIQLHIHILLFRYYDEPHIYKVLLGLSLVFSSHTFGRTFRRTFSRTFFLSTALIADASQVLPVKYNFNSSCNS